MEALSLLEVTVVGGNPILVILLDNRREKPFDWKASLDGGEVKNMRIEAVVYKNNLLLFQRISLTVFLFLSLFLLGTSVSAKSLNLSEPAGDNDTFEGPRYSILYERVLKLEEQGELLKALRMIPGIYAADDIPTDAFFDTLGNKRSQLIDAVIQQDIPFRIGKNKSHSSDVMKLFTDHYIGKPNPYNPLAPVADDFEFKRFCYLMIIEGFRHEPSSGGSILIPPSSRFALQTALDSSDPWLVSAALFFARKQEKPTISPQAVIDRWEKRPDLWDTQSIQQAMLFFAQLDAKAYEKLQVTNEDIKMHLEELQPLTNK